MRDMSGSVQGTEGPSTVRRIASATTVLVAVALAVSVAVVASATRSAAAAVAPAGSLTCSSVAGVTQWNPPLRNASRSHTVKVVAAVDDCDATNVTGGSAPIRSVAFTATGKVSRASCATATSALGLKLDGTLRFYKGAHQTGATVSTSTTKGVGLSFAASPATGSVASGGFKGERFALAATDATPPALEPELCSSPFGLAETDFTGSLSIATPLAAPVLSLTLTSDLIVRLSWSTVKGAIGYEIDRGEEGGPLTPFASTTSPSFDDASVIPNEPEGLYGYDVRAVVGTITSPASNDESASIVAPPSMDAALTCDTVHDTLDAVVSEVPSTAVASFVLRVSAGSTTTTGTSPGNEHALSAPYPAEGEPFTVFVLGLSASDVPLAGAWTPSIGC